MLSKRLTFRPFALALLAAAMCGPLEAAELGEVKVNSHIGQQLSADIELVDLTPADLADIQVRLANPDVFKGASLDVPSELLGLRISIARRDNKRFLHLTTLQAVNTGALHLFLELNSGGRQLIRAASLWLTPEAPGPRVTPVPPPPAPTALAVAGEAGLSEAAQRAFAHRREMAMAQAAEQAPPPAVPAAPKAEAIAQPAARAPLRKSPARPADTVAAPAAAPAQSCAPAKQVEAQLQQCQAMTSKLADVEGKVLRLQKAMIPAAAASTLAKPDAAPAKPQAAASKPNHVPAKPGATPVQAGVAADLASNPRKRLLMIVGGALAGLAALGGLVFFLRKRQAKGPLKIWQSFRKKGNADEDVPTLEDAVELAAQ